MRILYGVQGTGNGHVSRARALGPALQKHGAEVDFLFSGRDSDRYFDMTTFGRYEVRRGVTFVVEQGRIRRWDTLRQVRAGRFLVDVRQLRLAHYDLVVTDFEPVTAWAARRAGVASLHLSHQAAFAHDVPRAGHNPAIRALMRWYAPARWSMGLHWHHFGQPVLPPLIESNHTASGAGDPASGDAGGAELHSAGDADPAVLVYLPFESLAAIARLLRQFPAQRFVCYHPDITHDHDEPTVAWRGLSRAGFQRALARANGVICNAGFELPSEALALGRKLLVKPIRGQFEQASNALALERLQLATAVTDLEADAVAQWLALPPAEPVRYPAVADALAQWVLAGRWDAESQAALRDRLWREVRFPAHARLPESAQS